MWHNRYIGIPYKSNGRDFDGIDCWGLVRLIYNKEFNISLPSFSEDYTEGDTERMVELLAQYREGWDPVSIEDVKSGDLVLFKILGEESHVGLITEYPYFIHARDGYSSSIERLDFDKWKNRYVGIYRYTPVAKNNLIAIPNPLRTETIQELVPEGVTLKQIHEQLQEQYGSGLINARTIILVNGVLYPEYKWDYVVKEGDVLAYRSVPAGGDGLGGLFRLVAIVAISYFTFGGGLASLAGEFGASAGLFQAGSFSLAVLQAGVMTAGMALMNKIMPIRPPTMPNRTDPGSANAQTMINGAANNPTPYQPIPVVLGSIRMTPPLGAQNYIEPLTTETNLHLMLVWGYGPLDIQDMRIGSNNISDYEIPKIKTIYGYGTESVDEIKSLNNTYGSENGGNDIQQVFKNIKLVGTEGTPVASPWQEVTFTQSANLLKVHITFPQGLRVINQKTGDILPAQFVGQVEYDLASSSSTITDGSWGSHLYYYAGTSFTLPNNGVVIEESDPEYGVWRRFFFTPAYYRWSIVYALRDSSGNAAGVQIAHGDTVETKYGAPVESVVDGFFRALVYKNRTLSRLPTLPLGAIPLYQVCINQSSVTDIIKVGTHSFTASATGLVLNISSGTVTGAESRTFSIGADGEAFNRQKDSFTYTIDLPLPNEGVYKVRVRRINSGASDPSGSDYATFHDGYFYGATAYSNNPPVTDDSMTGSYYARTAMVVKATDQLNGTIDAINAQVTSICKDWDSGTGTWVKRPTNNPASLFLYVLQHPANAQRIPDSEVTSKVDLTQLQYWHAYCVSKGFTFNTVLSSVRSILDVLRDIAAAGRASPSLIDGKWSVIIDEPKTQVVQHFSTHNSWGFQAAKPLVKIPDAFKVNFYNEKLGYQQDEIYVYNTGKNASNATVFESVEFPGVTSSAAVYKHARWHLAQLKLRPETYKLSTDLEYLVCNRGDLVRVQHDVPQWGVGTGRITEWIDSTHVKIDNEVQLMVGQTYTVRIRLANGNSKTVNLAPVTQTGYYSTLTFASTVTSTEGAADNLVLIGFLNSESAECLVQSIEPGQNGTANLTLVDYNPAMYDVDGSLDYPIPDYTPNITRLPTDPKFSLVQFPTILSITSDASVAQMISPGVYVNRIKVAYKETIGQGSLDTSITHVELQWKLSSSLNWTDSVAVLLANDTLYATNVTKDEMYDVRIRYITQNGTSGPWTTYIHHTVSGKSVNYSVNPPAISLDLNGTYIEVTPEVVLTQSLDYKAYEFRLYKNPTVGDFWDQDPATHGILVKQSTGSTRFNLMDIPLPRIDPDGTAYAVACRVIDTNNNYSVNSSLAQIIIKTIV